MESNQGRSAYLTGLTAGPNRLSAWKCGCNMNKMGAISLWDDREAMALNYRPLWAEHSVADS